MSYGEFRGTPFQQTATAAGNATATQTGVALQTIYVTDVSVSSDLAGGTVQIKDGSTVIWQGVIGAGNYNHTFGTPLKATTGNTVTCVTTATAAGNSNISGYIINNS